MTVKNNRCNELGVCQGLGPDQCPDCNARPTYPFAPGTIEGPKLPIVYLDEDGPWLPLSLAETLKLLAAMLVLGTVAGYLVERFV